MVSAPSMWSTVASTPAYRAAELVRSAAHPHAAAGGALDPEQERSHVQRDPLREGEIEIIRERHVVSRARHHLLDLGAAALRWGEDREEPAREPALPRFRKIDVPGRLAVEEGALGRVAAAPEEAQERVIMPVEDGKRSAGHGRRRGFARNHPRTAGRGPPTPAWSSGQDHFRLSHVSNAKLPPDERDRRRTVHA